jgi:hypothetical protein
MGKMGVKAGLDLLNIVWPEFVEVNGAIVRKDGPQAFGAEDLDATGRDAFASHQHILDLFHHRAGSEGADDADGFYNPTHPDFIAACEFGKKLAEVWFTKLQKDFPHYRFRVYYTEDDDPIVRFHRVRDGEPVWLSEEDWERDIAAGKVIVFESGR